MYFALSKILGFFSVPSNLICVLALTAIIISILKRPTGWILAFAALTSLVIAGFSPLGNILLTPLEQRFPGMKFPEEQIAGIIVLGGSYDTQIRGYISTIILGESTARMAVVPELARRYPNAKVVFSGGDGSLLGTADAGKGEANIAKQLFITFGIEEARILIEDKSRNTEENARFSSQLLHPGSQSTWLLVTSAYHLPRAMGSFRQAGFNVVGFPTGWRTHGWRDFWRPEGTATENLRRIDVAVREWIGLFVYRILGYSSGWFPGPNH